MARTGKWPARVALAISAAMIATLFTVINASGQGTGGEALPTVGIDVQSATNTQVTYAIVVRNQGSAPSTNVTVRSNVPTDTTFESSNPPPGTTTSPSSGAQSCDNAGTREDPGRTCQWNLGTVAPGEARQITAIYNLNQSDVATYSVSITANVTDSEGHSNSDTDASLTRARHAIDHDTWVNDDEPPNYNHGQCPNLRVHQNNRVTSFLRSNTLPAESNIDKVWGALLQAQVQSTSYTEGAPGSIGAHRITSATWTEGAQDTAGNQNCPGGPSSTTTDARTGAEPQSAPNATSTAVVNRFPQFATWDVTNDLNDATERGSNNNGWELRDVIGAGDNTTRFHSGEAANADQQPKLFVVHTTPEAASCVDADPENATNAFGTEHIITALVTDGTRFKNAGGDGCNGGPATDTVTWSIEDDTPDAYFSSQEGQPITKTVQGGNAGPNTVSTVAEDGSTNVGLSQNAPAEGANRVEARIVEDTTPNDPTDPGSDPDPNGTPANPVCQVPAPPTQVDCSGETNEHDDVIKNWSASGASGSSGTRSTTGGTSSTTPSSGGSSTSPTSSSSSGGTPSSTSSTTGSPSTTTSRPPSGTTSSSSAGQSPRQVTFFTTSNEVVYPGTVTLSGQIVSNDNSCDDAGEFVRVQRRVFGETEFSNYRSANTDAQGGYEFTIPAEESAEYLALAPAHDNCADATSNTETVLVKVKVTARAGRRTVERRANVGIVGRVQPDHDGTEVILQRKRGARWVKVSDAELNGRSRYRFVMRAGWKGRRVFRVVWPSQDSEHEANRSRNVVIRTRRP